LPTIEQLNIMYDRRGRRKCKIGVVAEARCINPLCMVFQLYDVLRFDSTVVINALSNTSSPKLNNLICFYFEA